MILYKKCDKKEEDKLVNFMKKTDRLFPIPLSKKQNIGQLCKKLLLLGVVIAAYSQDDIVGALCGYSNNKEEGKAYISVLGVLPEYQGKSIAKSLIQKFIAHCTDEHMKSIVLYTHKTNEKAIALYKKSGFAEIESDREGDIKFYLHL